MDLHLLLNYLSHERTAELKSLAGTSVIVRKRKWMLQARLLYVPLTHTVLKV